MILAACDQDNVDEAIGDFIKTLLWGFFKIILISLGLLVAWAAAAVIGGTIIALGVRRKKLDALALAAILLGTAVVVGA